MARYVLITGSAGLIGSEAVEFFAKKNLKLQAQIITIENFFLEIVDPWEKEINS